MTSAQLEDIRNETTLSTVRQLRSIIIDSAKYIKSNDATFKISTLPGLSDKLSSLMKSYVNVARGLSATQDAFIIVNEQVEKLEEDNDFIDLKTYSTLLESCIDEQKKVKKAQKFEEDANKSLSQVLKSNIDDEVMVDEQSIQIPKDPITMTLVKFAVKSTICNHVFDKDSIERFLGKSQAVKCPVAGCQNRTLSRGQLVPDHTINQLIQSS